MTDELKPSDAMEMRLQALEDRATALEVQVTLLTARCAALEARTAPLQLAGFPLPTAAAAPGVVTYTGAATATAVPFAGTVSVGGFAPFSGAAAAVPGTFTTGTAVWPTPASVVWPERKP